MRDIDWKDKVKPITDKCKLGVASGLSVCFTPDAAKAMITLLDLMATILDDIEQERQDRDLCI